jgi:hypothetical protein
LSVSWRLLFSWRLVLILLRHLIGVLARLRQSDDRRAAPARTASD